MKINEILNEIDEFEFDELKNEVAELTDENAHTEALLAIVNFFNLEEFKEFLNNLKEYQDSPNYRGLTMEQAQERHAVYEKILDRLEELIGEEKLKEIYSCL